MYFESLIPKIHDYVIQNDPAWIFLEGDLGAGKTTLVQEYCQTMGSQNLCVQSPTFLKVLEYELNGFGKILHMDFYRMEEASEIMKLGLENYQDIRVNFLEWPEKFSIFLKEHPQWKDVLDCHRVLMVQLSDTHQEQDVQLSELIL
jgi:tRNA threonylcarbamoyladenosine biosynthesis protein TsaE